MKRRPTMTDVAREAGVGVATVDRVLNRRVPVRESTAVRVVEAARRLGYRSSELTEGRTPAGRLRLRFGFVLHKASQPFYQAFARELQNAVRERADVDGRLVIGFSPSQAPSDFAAEIRAIARRSDILACSSVNHPEPGRAVAELAAKGMATFALLSDFAFDSRQGYVGLDNGRVGRIAAALLTTVAREPGTLAVFVGGSRWHGQKQRELGFAACVGDLAPDFRMAETAINLETRQLTYETTLRLIDRTPDLRGIYVAGGGMEGAIAALREARPAGVSLVVNELTPESVSGLRDRTVSLVISTPLAELCRSLVDQMIGHATGRPEAGKDRFLEPRLYLPESV